MALITVIIMHHVRIVLVHLIVLVTLDMLGMALPVFGMAFIECYVYNSLCILQISQMQILSIWNLPEVIVRLIAL